MDENDLPLELRAVARRYAAYPVPRPTPEATVRLVARLLAEEPVTALAASAGRWHVLAALRVARWRMRLLGSWFWAASVLLLVVGATLVPVTHAAGSAVAPLVLLAPLTAVLGLAHAVRTSSSGLRAVEASCPLGFVEVTAGLVLAIVGFDCALGVAATAILALARWAPFAALLAAWLGPLLLLAGISLPIALRWGALPAAAIGGGPWLLLALIALVAPHGLPAQLFALPQGSLALALHAGAAALGGLLLLLVLVRSPAWQRVPLSPAGG